MNTRSAGATILAALSCALFPPGCRTPEGRADSVRVLALAPIDLASAPAFRSELLFATPRVSVHHTLLKERLSPHFHLDHEETVIVLEGRARMLIGEAWHEIGPGSVTHVPLGVVHAVEPLGPGGFVGAVSIFSPPFDGKDRVFLEP